jgi:F-type H+-transporting ATPase subunit delta
MSLSSVAERYARAIYELGVESGDLKGLTEQIKRFTEAYTASDELRAVLDNPLVEPGQRDAILREIAARVSVGPLAQNALRLLASRHRLAALPFIARRLSTLADENAGVVRATVVSAISLPEDYYRQLEKQLEQGLGRTVILERQEDPSLLGGIVTRIGDNIIDGSIKGRLHELERRLLAPA